MMEVGTVLPLLLIDSRLLIFLSWVSKIVSPMLMYFVHAC